MKVPRDLSGDDLANALSKLGYQPTRQTGSHWRLTTYRSGEHHVTIPRHDFLKIGTLSGILNDVAAHLGISRRELHEELFGR
jgi:predicted RNA binding protein YcfA (HicA-like mRNA interferase family)